MQGEVIILTLYFIQLELISTCIDGTIYTYNFDIIAVCIPVHLISTCLYSKQSQCSKESA